MGTFIGFFVALEALSAFSDHNAGLGPVETATRFLWACGPAALITMLAALWSRVEHQAETAAPWIRMSKGPAPAEKTLLLDYASMVRPRALFSAITNGDGVVACTVTISLVLRILIILSTALVAPTLLDGTRRQTVPISLNTNFANDPARLETGPSSMAFYMMLGLQQDGMSFPDGTSSMFAYQQFSSSLPASSSVDTSVDAFSASLDCEAARLDVAGVEYDGTSVRFDSTLDAPDCLVSMPIQSTRFFRSDATVNAGSPRYFARFGTGGCGGSDAEQDQRVAVVFGIETLDSGSIPDDPPDGSVPVNGSITQSTQLLCRPAYTISRVDLRKNGTDLLNIDLSNPPLNRTLDRVQPWDIAQAMFASYDSDLASAVNDTTPSFYLPNFLNVDPPMYLALGMQRTRARDLPPPSDFLNETTLRTLAMDYFQQYTALLASASLAEPTAASSTGTAAVPGERLVVRGVTVHIMTGLFALAIVLAGVIMWFVPRKGFLPRDPNSIIDTAALTGHSRPLLQALRGAGGAKSGVLRERLAGSEYSIGVEPYEGGSSRSTGYFKIFGSPLAQEAGSVHVERRDTFTGPISLHPASRMVMTLLLAGAIAGLEISLRSSQDNGGFGAVEDGDNSHLLWTAVPVLIMVLLAAYFGLADFMTRALAPYVALRQGGSYEETVNLNYLDRAAIVVLYGSIRSRNAAVATTTAALLVSSLFAIFTAPLFSAITPSSASQVPLFSPDPFTEVDLGTALQSCDSCRDGPMVASLVLSGNMSYPPFTFQDLNLPPLTVGDGQESMAIPEDSTISVTLPAVRPVMACRMFSGTEITTNLTLSYSLDGKVNPLRIDIPGEAGSGNTESDSSTFTLGTAGQASDGGRSTIPKGAFFGATRYRQIKSANSAATPHWVYVWGELSDANSNRTAVKAISGMACNESVERVSAMTTFFGSSLTITESNPPVVHSTVAPITEPLPPESNSTSFYDQLVQLPTPHILDRFFATLLSSRYAIPAGALGATNPNVAQRVAAAIVDQHKIIRTQVLREMARQPRKAFPAPAESASPGSTASGAFMGTLATTATGGVRRTVVQDVVATRVLQVLLAVAAALGLAGWASLRAQGGTGGVGAGKTAAAMAAVHPRAASSRGGGLCSIASTAALLADGNTFGLLGRTAEWQAPDRLRALFMDGLHVTRRFRLAWEAPRRRRREETLASWGMEGVSSADRQRGEELFGVSAARTGGWGGGENVGLGLQARVGYGHRQHVRDWGWRT